jgi:hypothetical protein
MSAIHIFTILNDGDQFDYRIDYQSFGLVTITYIQTGESKEFTRELDFMYLGNNPTIQWGEVATEVLVRLGLPVLPTGLTAYDINDSHVNLATIGLVIKLAVKAIELQQLLDELNQELGNKLEINDLPF